VSLTIKDGITPELARIAREIKDRKPILEAMALQLVGVTKRAFYTPALRAAPWAPRKSEGPTKYKVREGLKGAGKTRTAKTHALLRLSGALWHSIRVDELTNDHATVATDRVYGAAQQFGYEPRKLPARPFFPFATPTSEMTPTAQEKIQKAARDKIRQILGGH
jgi:phage gpG-like protein